MFWHVEGGDGAEGIIQENHWAFHVKREVKSTDQQVPDPGIAPFLLYHPALFALTLSSCQRVSQHRNYTPWNTYIRPCRHRQAPLVPTRSYQPFHRTLPYNLWDELSLGFLSQQ